uniref:Pentatricopeptide repeat-containing protein n=1 Tax=Chenopodium quinoa TaxID=63459 RepID=A0A803M9H4_CHEQI
MAYELIVSHFNVLLSAAMKRGIWRWGLKLLDKMEAKGLKPRSREWNAVLIACSKASEATAAVEIFKRMIERGEKPTVISYGALLSALEKGKLYDEAVRVWEHMRKIGVEPNLYAYTIMASVYVGLRKFNLVDYIVQEMVSIGINPTVVTFNAIISVCTKNGLAGAAYEWFQRMRSMSIDPNEITYDTLIKALANDGKPRLAYDLYLSALNEDLKPSLKAYDAILQSSRILGATIDISALGPRPPEKKKKVPTKKNQSESGTVIDLHSQSNSFVREETHAQEAAKYLLSTLVIELYHAFSAKFNVYFEQEGFLFSFDDSLNSPLDAESVGHCLLNAYPLVLKLSFGSVLQSSMSIDDNYTSSELGSAHIGWSNPDTGWVEAAPDSPAIY